jgi:hypothetical protein
MSAMSRAIRQDLSDQSSCSYFAVCESCLLVATILESRKGCSIAYCPRCLEKVTLSLIPLSFGEIYTLSH